MIFDMNTLYQITGRELLALLSMIPDENETTRTILDLIGRRRSGTNEHHNDLKPCPFCGSTDVHLVEDDPGKGEISITCKDCNVWVDHMFDAMSMDEAIELWNRRVKE